MEQVNELLTQWTQNITELKTIRNHLEQETKHYGQKHHIPKKPKTNFNNQDNGTKKVYELWQELYKITGDSQEAFNIYVQRLTLKQLLVLANRHLLRLNERYSLKMPETYTKGQELNFYLVDHYQTGRLRPVETASGDTLFKLRKKEGKKNFSAPVSFIRTWSTRVLTFIPFCLGCKQNYKIFHATNIRG